MSQEIEQKITKAIDNLVTLKITTRVKADASPHEMLTTINLVDGDIVNTMDREFITGDLKELREFHEAQVLKGQQIIKDNIDALKALWSLVKDRAAG